MARELDMTKLSDNFYRYEFECKCGCGGNTQDTETMLVVQDVRDAFDSPVFVNSGYRCPDYNKRIGGAPESQHMYGRANDIRVSGVSPKRVADYLERKYPGKYGIGRYRSFTHVDTKSGLARRWGRN